MDRLRRSHAYQWQRLWALTVCLNERQYWTSLALSHAPSLSLCSGQTQFPAPVSRKWDAVCFFISVLCYVLMASVFVSLHCFIFCIPKNKSGSCIEWHIWTDSNIDSQLFYLTVLTFRLRILSLYLSIAIFISCISGFSFQNCEFISLHFEVIHC